MTDVAVLHEQLSSARALLHLTQADLAIARADLRVKDEQLNSAHALLTRVEADLAIARGDIRVKDEQLEQQSDRYQEQLCVKDEEIAVKNVQLQQQHEERALLLEERTRLLEERTRLHDRFDGHLDSLLNAHRTTLLNAHQATRQHITDQLQGLEARHTRHPNNAKKHHGFAALLTPEGNGVYEHRLIRGQRKHVLKMIEASGPHEVLRPFTTAGNGVNLGNNFVRVMTQKLDQQYGAMQAQARGFRIRSTRSKVVFTPGFTRQTIEDAYAELGNEIRQGSERLLDVLLHFDDNVYTSAYSVVQTDMIISRRLIPAG